MSIGAKAASRTGPLAITASQLPTARWMEDRHLAILNDRQELVLSEQALETTITIRNPILVVDPVDRNDQSIWALRKQLVHIGWKADPENPSVEQRRFHSGNICKKYFIILLDRDYSEITTF